MRKKLSIDQKRKSISFSVDPKVYDLWVDYCKENGIENYSEYIEMIIINKLQEKNVWEPK